MGCASSTEVDRDFVCPPRSPGAPPFRCRSMPHHRYVVKGSAIPRLVGPTSSFRHAKKDDENMMKSVNDKQSVVDRAKAWSEMMESRIPKPEPETKVNTWLEEPTIKSASFLSDFDPEIISNFRKTLSEISPYNQSRLLRSDEPKTPPLRGIVKARISAFEQKMEEKKGKRVPPGGEKKVVLYLTSLRGVRKTFEDCWATQVILQGYGVKVEERDVWIHGGFKEELEEAGMVGKSLPRVFANGMYLGGAEEVRRMHEAGELRGVLLDKCGLLMGGGGGCEGCGDVRFVLCQKCSGSCKLFVLQLQQGKEGGGSFRRCPNCNENGLVRCTICV